MLTSLHHSNVYTYAHTIIHICNYINYTIDKMQHSKILKVFSKEKKKTHAILHVKLCDKWIGPFQIITTCITHVFFLLYIF